MHQTLKKVLTILARHNHIIWALLFPCFLAVDGISAQTPPGNTEQCLSCHSEPPASNILNSVHGDGDNPATPFAQDGCGSCHGISENHAQNLAAPDVVFTQESDFFPASETGLQNSMCLTCHEADDRTLREAGIHRGNDLPCAACHTIHGGSR